MLDSAFTFTFAAIFVREALKENLVKGGLAIAKLKPLSYVVQNTSINH